jgi:multidrug resistance efflux pump
MMTGSSSFRRLGVLALALLSAGLMISAYAFLQPHSAGPVNGGAAQAAAPGAPTVVCFGHVDMEHGVTSLYPAVPGRVKSVDARENEAVQAGAVLVRLDDEMSRLRTRETKADLDAANEQLAQALRLPEQHQARSSQQRAAIEAVRHRLDGAQSLLARKRELAKIQQLNVKEVEAAGALVQELEALERAEKGKLRELELDDPGAAIKRAQADVAAKEARHEQARRGQEECVLRAPADGVVLRVLVRPGEVLGPQPRQPVLLFCPKGQRLVRAEVEQEFAGQIAVGQPATIVDDTSIGSSWRGKVMRISDWYTQRRSILQEPVQFSDVRTLECLISLDPGQPPLRIGQRVRVNIGVAAP